MTTDPSSERLWTVSNPTVPQGNPTGSRRVKRRQSAASVRSLDPTPTPTTTVVSDRAADLTTLLGSAPDNTEHDKVREYAHGLMKLGVAVMLVNPGEKYPFQWVRDDLGRGGVYTATTDATVFDGHLDVYLHRHGDECAVNLGAAAGASRLVVVDSDTRSQTEAFRRLVGMDPKTPPTVTSPGSQSSDGTWNHEQGNGHFWFTVPDGEVLPEAADSLADPEDEYAVKWGRGYVLIPPSTRKEGQYRATGTVAPLPKVLLDRIVQHGERRAQRAAKARTEVNPEDPIDGWGAGVTWAELLADTDWMNTGKSDTCGCDIWTAPGLHATDKSATAHEAGCGEWDESPDPPLHIWTDHDVDPFGELHRYSPTITRLQAYAAIHHDGDIGAAMEALDLTLDADLPEFGEKSLKSKATTGSELPRLWAPADMTPPVPVEWLAKGNIPRAALTVLVGGEGIGKSTWWAWLVAHVTTGRACMDYGLPAREAQNVVLSITEDDWSSVVLPRLTVAGADLDRIRVFCTDPDGSGSPVFPDHLDVLRKLGDEEGFVPALIVVDAWVDTLPAGLQVSNPQHARQALHPWKEYATETRASVVVLSHTNRQNTSSPRDKMGLTGELRKAARQVLFAHADEDNEDCILVGVEKANFVARGVEAHRFRIVPERLEGFTPTDDSDGMVTKADYVGTSGRSVQEIIADEFHGGGDDELSDKGDEAVNWLEDFLTIHRKTKSQEAKKEARVVGITERTLSRAAKQLQVRVTSEGFPRQTYWELAGGVEMPTTGTGQ
jgi:hypothetical protein